MCLEERKTLVADFTDTDRRASEHLIFKREVWGFAVGCPSPEAGGRAPIAWYGAGVSAAACGVAAFIHPCLHVSIHPRHPTELGWFVCL